LLDSAHCPPFVKAGIRMAGISRAADNFQFVRLNPDMAQVFVCFSGEGKVWTDGWQHCQPGQAYLTPAFQPHAYRSGRLWNAAWVILEPRTLPDLCSHPELVRVEGCPLASLLEDLIHEVETFGRADILELRTILLLRHLQLLRDASPTRLGALWRAVRKDLAIPWTLSRLASTAGLGEENLRLVCQRETGRSPMQQVTFLRMRHAAALLRLDHKVEYAAVQVGYENPFSFSTAFKRIMGHSPSTLRRNGDGRPKPFAFW